MRSLLLSCIGILGGLFGFGWLPGQATATTPASYRVNDYHRLAQTWNQVREGLEGEERSAEINPEILDILGCFDLDGGLEEAVRLSYKLAMPDEVAILDDLWIEVMMGRGDSQKIAQYLSIRASLDLMSLPRAGALADRWVWLVQSCDGMGGPQGNNGFGNGDQDAPGNSGDNNNAENATDGNNNGNGGNSGNNGNN